MGGQGFAFPRENLSLLESICLCPLPAQSNVWMSYVRRRWGGFNPLVLLIFLQVSGPHCAFHLPEIFQNPSVPGALPVRRVPTWGALRLPAWGQLPLCSQFYWAQGLAAAAIFRWVWLGWCYVYLSFFHCVPRTSWEGKKVSLACAYYLLCLLSGTEKRTKVFCEVIWPLSIYRNSAVIICWPESLSLGTSWIN